MGTRHKTPYTAGYADAMKAHEQMERRTAMTRIEELEEAILSWKSWHRTVADVVGVRVNERSVTLQAIRDKMRLLDACREELQHYAIDDNQLNGHSIVTYNCRCCGAGSDIKREDVQHFAGCAVAALLSQPDGKGGKR